MQINKEINQNITTWLSNVKKTQGIERLNGRMKMMGYQHARQKMIHTINYHAILTEDLLIRGNPQLSYNTKSTICLAVQEYIKDTNRFTQGQKLNRI